MAHRIRDFLFGKDARVFDETGEVVHPLPPRQWSEWDKHYATPENDWHMHQGTLTNDLNLSVSEPKHDGETLHSHEGHPDWRREISGDDAGKTEREKESSWRSWLPWSRH